MSQIGVYNEWGKLREVFIGIEDQTTVPQWREELKWADPQAIDDFKHHGGELSREVRPEEVEVLSQQIDGHAQRLADWGVKVNRTRPMTHPEDLHFLDDVQKGNMLFGGADFFRVIGNDVILLTNFRYPFRRKQVFAVRPVLEERLKGTGVRYAAMPPLSPRWDPDEPFLENGDIMVDGYNVYVGISGNASSESGAAWLQDFLGPKYRVQIIKLASNCLHIDCVCTLTRPGLMTYYPELVVGELPKPLKYWDKVEVYELEGEDEAFGANCLSLDEENIIVPEQYKRVADEYDKRGMNVIMGPYDATISYGSGPRCLTGVLRRDP